jgi:hypothetical protein
MTCLRRPAPPELQLHDPPRRKGLAGGPVAVFEFASH